MISTRRRGLFIKITICAAYVICIVVIASRLFLRDDSISSGRTNRHLPINNEQFLSQYQTVRSVAPNHRLVFKYKQFEQEILEYERNVVEGLGENGEPGYLYGVEKKRGEKALKARALNVVLSDKISLTRKLSDARDPLCQNVSYDTSQLPQASVVIIFFNEPWSVLLRTVYSVLNGTPASLLKEIILVDDSSDIDELKGKLDYYIATRLPDKVKIIRLPKREGLIRARLHGAKRAKGDVLVFLDAHCEVIRQWLEPLLQRIKDKPNTVTIPIIDNISEDTLEYFHDSDSWYFQVGGFTWSGHFTWINIQSGKSRSPIDPAASPTMAGGLFAIRTKYFWDIGSYDDKMDGWGGENLEMSFRIWQCGGRLETIPCSRVGHIFRNFHPYKFPNDKDTHGINTARLAYVWMDEYKRLFLLHREEFKNDKSIVGDISERVDLRSRLKCKSFKWYLQNVYPEKFVPDEGVRAHGRLKLSNRNLCLDNLQRDEDKPYNLGVYGCHGKLYPSQFFSLSAKGELRRDEICARVDETTDPETGIKLKRTKVQMIDCSNAKDNKEWVHHEGGKIIHVESGLCLDGTGIKSEEDIVVTTCNTSPGQRWKFDFYG